MSNEIDLRVALEELVTDYIGQQLADKPDYVVDGFIISCLENAVSMVRTKELGTKEIRESLKNAKATQGHNE